jgi:hypothetical protein
MWPQLARANRAALNTTWRFRARQISFQPGGYLKDFVFLPAFFSEQEQRFLLSASLAQLDQSDSRQYRRRRKEFLLNRNVEPASVQDLFLPDEYYCFEMAWASKHRFTRILTSSYLCFDRVILTAS